MTGTRIGKPFGVCTDDGVRIEGVRFRGRGSGLAFVICHGFCGSWRNVIPLAERLAQRGTVYAFDSRGHGSSTGLSTLGSLEAHDVRAVVGLAREECGPSTRIITIGASMGGIAVLREAADLGTSDAVVSISAPAEWMGQQLRSRLLGMLVTSAGGRALAKRYMSTRIEPTWMSPPPPVEIVASIRIPMLFVHGAKDRFVDPAQAHLLHAASGGRGRICIIDDAGHAEAAFDDRVVGIIDREISLLETGTLTGARA